MFINNSLYKSFKLLMIIPVVIGVSIAAGISAKAEFSLDFDDPSSNSDTQIILKWTSVPNAAYYEISRDDEIIKTINVNTERNFLSYTDTNLSPETEYTYTVKALNPEKDVIQTVSRIASTTEMIAPTIVTYYVDLNNKSVTIHWINNSKAVRKTSVIKLGEEDDIEIANIPNSGTSITFVDSDLEVNEEARYVLRSSDNDEVHTTPDSSIISVTPLEIPTLSAELVNNKNIKISWNTNTNIEKFLLQRSEYLKDSWGPWDTIVNNIKKDSNYVTDTLSDDGTYRYRLCLKDENYGGVSNISNPVARLIAPKNLQCVPASPQRIDLNWTNPQGWNYKLKVERRKSSSKDYSVLAELSSNVSSYSDTNDIELNTGYYYRITAYNESEKISASSSEYYIYTGPPQKASSLKADIQSSSRVTLYWKDNSDNEQGFIIERKTGSGSFTKIAEVSANVTKYTDGTLTVDNTYTYRVIPFNPYGNASSYSNELSFSTSLIKESPDSLTVSEVSANEITLTWTYADSVNYSTAIERKTGSNGNWEIIDILPSGYTTYSDKDVTDNKQYYYRVKTVIKDNVYSKPYPNNDTGISAHTKLRAPQNLKASWSAANTVKLTWTDKSNVAEYYIIERKTDDGIFVVADTVSSDDGNTWYDDSLSLGSTYTYRIKSVKETYSSDYSDEVTVEGYIVSAPTNLKASIVSESKITLTWKDNSDNESKFIIERKAESDKTWKEIGSVNPNITSYTVDKLKPDVLYKFRVIAYNSAYYSSSASDECEVIINSLSAPSDLTATAISSSTVILEWKDNSSGEQGFIIERRSRGGEFEEIAKTGPNTVKYSDNSVEAVEDYYYRVKAFKGSTYSGYTNISLTHTHVAKTFEDLNSVSWAKKSIEYLAGRDIIKGKSINPNIFAPNDKITRAEFINLVVISLQFNKTPVGTFEDVKPEHWFYKNVMIAKNMGIVSGIGNNLFYPNEPIKREDMAVILARALKISGITLPEHDISILNKYSDKNDISSYALTSMAILNGEKIINGKSSTILAPKDYATRAEAAVLLYNILINYKLTGTL